MTRFYAKPMLLIEFDDKKPFSLQGKYYISNDLQSADIVARLQLLTLHFPKLRWQLQTYRLHSDYKCVVMFYWHKHLEAFISWLYFPSEMFHPLTKCTSATTRILIPIRILWSPSPHATAELFDELKQGREQPDSAKAATLGVDIIDDFNLDKYNPQVT